MSGVRRLRMREIDRKARSENLVSKRATARSSKPKLLLISVHSEKKRSRISFRVKVEQRHDSDERWLELGLTYDSLHCGINLDLSSISTCLVAHRDVTISIRCGHRCLFGSLGWWHNDSHLLIAVLSGLLALRLPAVLHLSILGLLDAVFDRLLAVVRRLAGHGGR